jgi:hypothetical protein
MTFTVTPSGNIRVRRSHTPRYTSFGDTGNELHELLWDSFEANSWHMIRLWDRQNLKPWTSSHKQTFQRRLRNVANYFGFRVMFQWERNGPWVKYRASAKDPSRPPIEPNILDANHHRDILTNFHGSPDGPNLKWHVCCLEILCRCEVESAEGDFDALADFWKPPRLT